MNVLFNILLLLMKINEGYLETFLFINKNCKNIEKIK